MQSTAGKTPRFPQLALGQLNAQRKPLGEQVMKVSSVGIDRRPHRGR